MPNDTIVDEVHAIREQIAAEGESDLRKIAAAANARQEASGRPAETLPPRAPRTAPIPKRAS